MENFKAIIDEYHPILYKIGRSYTRHRADFDDLYQEMLIQIYQSLKSFRGESRMSTWLYRVALNTAMTFNRNNHKRQNEVAEADIARLERQEEPISEARKTDWDVEMLYEAIHELKKDDRAMILLHLEGKQYCDIADIMGISKTNTGVKLMRIRKRLQTILTRKGYERI